MTSTATTPLRTHSRARVAAAVGIGNFMEWFDFAIYGFFAVLLGQLFFPANSDPIVSLLQSLSVFAVGFFMRPLGAFILGPIGDKHGRKAALVVSVLLMGAATTLIGLLPTYQTAGVVATVLLVVLRCAQGIAAGGEWSGSAAFLVENAPDHRRGLYASLVSGTAALAFISGSATALLLQHTLPEQALFSWGWRLPFISAALMAIVGLYIRYRLTDTPVFEHLERAGAVADAPLKASADRRNLKAILITFAFSSVSGLGIYYLATYLNNHLTVVVGMERGTALLLSGSGLFLYMLMCPAAGMLSDRFGRRSLNIAGTVGFAVLSVPAFALMDTGAPAAVIGSLVLLGACQSLCSVTNVVLLVELFPASTRSSGSAVGYNLGLAFVAGPGPLIAAALVNATGHPTSPAWYFVAVTVAVTPVLLRWLPETFHRSIDDNNHAV